MNDHLNDADGASTGVKELTFTKACSQTNFAQAVSVETFTSNVLALPSSQHVPPCTPQHSTQANDTGDTQTQEEESYTPIGQEDEDELLNFTALLPPSKRMKVASTPPSKSASPALKPVSPTPAPPPPVSQWETLIRTTVKFPSSDFIFYTGATKGTYFSPMVRISDINMLSLEAKQSLEEDAARYFPDGELADNLYLAITPKGEQFDMWLVTPSAKKAFTLDRNKWPAKAKKAMESKQPVYKLREALLEAEKMYTLAVEREAEAEREVERSEQLVSTLVVAEEEEEEAPRVAPAFHEARSIAFRVGMKLWVQSHLEPEAAMRSVLEIKPKDGELGFSVRLDNDHWLVDSDWVAEPQLVRYGELKQGSTFAVGKSARESRVTQQMRLEQEARLAMRSEFQQHFPEYANLLQPDQTRLATATTAAAAAAAPREGEEEEDEK